MCTLLCGVLCVSQGFDLPSIYLRLLLRSTATLRFLWSSQACGDTSKTPTSERSSNRRVRPTLKLKRLTLTWPTRGNKLFIICNSCPVFTKCNHACKDVEDAKRINCGNESHYSTLKTLT